jgi:hypothetical protein
MTTFCIEPPADMSTLPDPPVPVDLDLRHFDCMHLNTVDLLSSPIWEECSDAGVAMALRLWAKAWQQVPCSSLPNDLKKVRSWAGCEGRGKRFSQSKLDALRGFVLCSDGRLYHHKVAEAASSAMSKSRAGKRGAKAKWDKVNALKTHKTGDATASSRTHNRDDGNRDGKTDGTGPSKALAETMQRREGNTLPPYPPLCSAGSGSLEAPPDRPPQPPVSQPSEGDPVEVELDTGAKLRITRTGQVDEIYAPRDCPPTALTRQQALDLRAKAIADRRLRERVG